MRDGAQGSENSCQGVITEGQRVASGKNHFAYFPFLPDIIEHGLKIRLPADLPLIPPQPFAVTVPAIDGADIGQQHQATVRIPVNQTRNRHITPFLKRILYTAQRKLNFL